MPEKDGAEEKSTKSVVNKRQKQMMGEEGYDIARDMGRVRPSKDKKDATTMPVSDEVKKTQKVNKGPSAFERVKARYGKSVMKVEELDLSKVAEAFGGYIIEAEVTKGQGGGRKKKLTGSGKVTFGRGRTPQEITGVERLAKAAGIDTDKYKKLLNPENKKQAAAAQAFRDISASGEKVTDDMKQGLRNVAQGGDEEPKPYTPRGRRAERDPEIAAMTPGQKERNIRRIKKDIDAKNPTIQTQVGPVPYRNRRVPKTRSLVPQYDRTPEIMKPDTDKLLDPKKKKFAPSFVPTMEPRKEPKTQTQPEGGEPPIPPKPTAVGAGGDKPKKTDAFSSIKKFAKKNPQIAAAGALAAYDLGKGILGKIMNVKGAVPGVVGGTVGRRSARGGGGL